MARIGKYNQRNFTPATKLLSYDSDGQVTALVPGQSLIDYIGLEDLILELNDKVQVVRTTDLAVTEDLPVGRVIYTTGVSVENDGGGGHYVVVIAGTGGIPMDNGNELLLLPIGDLAGSNATGADVTTSTGTQTLGVALDDRVVRVGSITDLSDITPSDKMQFSVSEFWPDTGVGGGIFKWEATRSKTDHNGGTVIDPDKLSELGAIGVFGTYFTAAGSGAGCFVSVGNQSKVYLDQFGMVDGSSVDFGSTLVHVIKTADASNLDIDGNGGTYLLTGTFSETLSNKVHLENANFTIGTDYTDQFQLDVTGDISINFSRMTLDGERDVRTELEPWSVFSSLFGVDSIHPVPNHFFRTNTYITKPAVIKDVNVNNLHTKQPFRIFSYGAVSVINYYVDNLSGKHFHIWHSPTEASDPGTGITFLANHRSTNTGILPNDFLVDGVPKTRADNFAPQESFGAIVTFGRYISKGVFCQNYGSIAICGDRNRVWQASDTQIKHDDPNAYSNNSSGGFWNESCDVCQVTNLEIEVSARDSRETVLDNSLLQIYLEAGETMTVNGLRLKTITGAKINKTVRASLQENTSLIVNDYFIEDEDTNFSINVAGINNLSDLVSFAEGEVIGGFPILLRDSNNAKLSRTVTEGPVTFSGTLSLPIGDVSITDDCVIPLTTTISGANGDILISASKLNTTLVSADSGSWFETINIGGGSKLTASTIISGGKSARVGDVETYRRVEFRDVERCFAGGGEFKTDVSEPILWANPTAPGIMLQATFLSNALWIKAGTAGAGYTSFNANVGNSTDLNNDKQTFAWT